MPVRPFNVSVACGVPASLVRRYAPSKRQSAVLVSNVLAGDRSPSTPMLRAAKVVDGGPSPAMTFGGPASANAGSSWCGYGLILSQVSAK